MRPVHFSSLQVRFDEKIAGSEAWLRFRDESDPARQGELEITLNGESQSVMACFEQQEDIAELTRQHIAQPPALRQLDTQRLKKLLSAYTQRVSDADTTYGEAGQFARLWRSTLNLLTRRQQNGLQSDTESIYTFCDLPSRSAYRATAAGSGRFSRQ